MIKNARPKRNKANRFSTDKLLTDVVNILTFSGGNVYLKRGVLDGAEKNTCFGLFVSCRTKHLRMAVLSALEKANSSHDRSGFEASVAEPVCRQP